MQRHTYSACEYQLVQIEFDVSDRERALFVIEFDIYELNEFNIMCTY